MTYFNNVNTLKELRKQYKELLKKFHPDNPNGSTEATQAINTEYDRLFKQLKNKHESKQTSTDGAKADFNNYKYDFEADEKLREILQKIISFANINIEIVGCWLWVDGNTYEYKDTLKALGFKWAREKKEMVFSYRSIQKTEQKKVVNGRYTELIRKYRSTDGRKKAVETGIKK